MWGIVTKSSCGHTGTAESNVDCYPIDVDDVKRVREHDKQERQKDKKTALSCAKQAPLPHLKSIPHFDPESSPEH